MRKRILSAVLALMLMLTAFPVTAFATQSYELVIGGTAVNSKNAGNVFGDGTVSFNAKESVLTLNGASIAGKLIDDVYVAIYYNSESGKELTINVKAPSTLSCKTGKNSDSSELCGVYCENDVTLKGELLTIRLKESDVACGIWCGGSLTIRKGELEAYASYAKEKGVGVYAKENLTFDKCDTRIFGTTAAFIVGANLSFQRGTFFMDSVEAGDYGTSGYNYLITYSTTFYTVQWRNYDDTLLETDTMVSYGSMPCYDGETPEKPYDGEYYYVFNGWDKTIKPVKSNITYYATYKRSTTPPSDKDKEKDKEDSQKTEEEKKIIKTDTDKKDVKGSRFLPLMLNAKAKKRNIKLSWKRMKKADGYIIYGTRCGNKKMEKLKTIKNGKKKTYTFKKLKKGKYYKYILIAYKNTKKGKQVLAVSKTVHCTTSGGKKGNPTGIKLKTKAVKLKKNKKLQLKPKLRSKRKVATHIAKFRYESSNKKVAKVTKDGLIKAKKKGTAYIYVYTQNGIYKRVKVTVQ